MSSEISGPGGAGSVRSRKTGSLLVPEAPNSADSSVYSDDSTATYTSSSWAGPGGREESKTDKKTASKRHKRRKSYINVVPLNTPLERRLQTLAVAWHTMTIPTFCCLFLLTVYAGKISWLVVVLPYFIYLYAYDLHTPTNGKAVYRVKHAMRNLVLWRWFVNYFPISVHKTCDLEPTFTTEMVEAESASDDEQDLVSEYANSVVDDLFQFLRLRKRLNQESAAKVESNNKSGKVSRVATGPRYIFGYHPHGVISMGVMGIFATNVLRNEPFTPPFSFLKSFFHDPSKGERLFPGIGNVFVLTLTEQFVMPFFRDYLLSMGFTSAGGKNIKSVISNGDNSVCLVVGGAQESLLNDVVGSNHRVGIGYKDAAKLAKDKASVVSENHDKTVESETASSMARKQIRLVLNKRKGFVKLAIELGNVSLVPVFAFGEADVYRLTRPPPGSWGYAFQKWMKDTFHFTLPFFSARGVFIYDFGFLPYRTPINIVTGRPIYVPSGLLSEEYEDSAPRKQRSSSFTSLLSLKKKKPHTTRKRKVPQDLLDHYHGLYVEELKRLYEDNREEFGYGDVELKIIE